VAPFSIVNCFFVFKRAGVNRAAGFTYVDGVLATAALELINAFAFARWGLGLISTA
jgi:hypothetical protein